MKEILNNSKTGLRLFDDIITTDYSLPKWVNAKKNSKTQGGNHYTYTIVQGSMDSTTNSDPSTIVTLNNNFFQDGVEPPKDGNASFDEIASLGLQDLNKFVNENRNGILSCLGYSGSFEGSTPTPFMAEYTPKTGEHESSGIISKIKSLFKKKEIPELDIIQFFAAIKATSLESANGYINRVSKYLRAIHKASSIGQTALVSKLAREMVGNKYESFLAAEGYYYVVKEEDVVKFARKSEKGIAIDYIKNFARPIPDEVADKIVKANALEIFDNYVIMHYDPESKSYMDTPKEEAKRRDPIVFGVIAGSRKLYYITDWIDEYCDLTLEKFVDTIGISKDDLVEDEIEKSKIDEARAAKAKEEAAKKAAAKKAEKKETKKTVKTEKKTNTKKRTTKKSK